MSKRNARSNAKGGKKSGSEAGRRATVPRGTRGKVRPRAGEPIPARSQRKGGREDIEIIARGCLIRASKVLLCQNLKHGYYYLPGGHVEFGESAAHAVAREFLEETALRIRVGELALVSEGAFATKKRDHHEFNLVFHVEQGATGAGTGDPFPVPSQEPKIRFDWMELAAIPETDVRPVAVKAWLASGVNRATPGVEWVSEMTA